MFKRPFRISLWFFLGGIIAFLGLFPLKWVGPHFLPDSLISSNTRYAGTIWKGQISKLNDLDRVTYRLKPLNIVFGKLPLTFAATDKGLSVNGQAGPGGAETISFKINIADLPLPDPRLKGLAGLGTAQIENVSWDKSGACKDISGRVQSNVLMQNRSLFNWVGPIISGPIKCGDEGGYLFSLSGQDDTQIIKAQISISAAGTYTSDISVITRDRNAAMALPLFGFEEKGTTSQGRQFALIEQGRWQ